MKSSFLTAISLFVLSMHVLAQTTSPPAKTSDKKPSLVNAVAFHPNSKVLAVGGYTDVRLFDTTSGDLASSLTGQTKHVTALVFSQSHLAIASGEPGKSGEIRLYGIQPSGLPELQPRQVLTGHKDLVYALAFSPDGKTVASSGYDRTIKLFEVATGREIMTLRDHSDTVYGLATSPDGKMLASGSADRAVKVWDVASGKRLHTLSDSTDWVYPVAWSPDGKHVAAGSVDKSIRIWEVSADKAKLTQSVFAHEAAVSRLIYSNDGHTLYSLGEDHIIKSWDTSNLVERRVYPKQPVATLALALQPDGKQLAVGRFDGSVDLLDEQSGQVTLQLLPAKPKPPQLVKLTPNYGMRGQTVKLSLEGKYLDNTEFVLGRPGVTAKLLPAGCTSNKLEAEITFPSTTPAGVYQIGLKNAVGPSNTLGFTVDPFPLVVEKEPNNSLATSQRIMLPASIAGNLQKAGDVDYYQFEAQAGQQLGVQVLATAAGSKLDPVITLVDEADRILAESAAGFLGYTFAKAGLFAISIRDREYRGGDLTYRLHAGSIPVVTSLFPLGIQRGTETDIHVSGVFLGETKTVHVKAPAETSLGSRLTVPVNISGGLPLGNLSVEVGEFPEAVHNGSPATGHALISTPGTANGRVAQPGDVQTWRFSAKKGERLLLEVKARRLGSPLDSYIEILDAKGQPLPRAVLRCVSKTYTVFRDHDSSGAGIRMETWNNLSVNDYLYVGSELLKIFSLPRNPDDDCIFYSLNGQREGFLGTTPSYISLGTPMYKVSMHPPGTSFPPNGLPLVTLFYRNDDGGHGFGKDSRLVFDPPADGEYQVRIGDSRGQGGSDFVYRLTVRPPRPSFNVSFNPTAPTVWKGGAIPITVTAERVDEFDGPIEVKLDNLPSGFSAPPTAIPEGERSTSFALYADPSAVTPDAKSLPPKLIATAKINDQVVKREVTGMLPKLADSADLVTTTDLSEISVKPGHEVRLAVKIERRNGFAGRVPVEVSGLPHGVHVLDIGLNGILITERETTRTMVIRAEPWVKPIEHPFVVFAVREIVQNREGKGTQYAAKSVMLKVVK
jgi:WD40 repeat protein